MVKKNQNKIGRICCCSPVHAQTGREAVARDRTYRRDESGDLERKKTPCRPEGGRAELGENSHQQAEHLKTPNPTLHFQVHP